MTLLLTRSTQPAARLCYGKSVCPESIIIIIIIIIFAQKDNIQQ